MIYEIIVSKFENLNLSPRMMRPYNQTLKRIFKVHKRYDIVCSKYVDLNPLWPATFEHLSNLKHAWKLLLWKAFWLSFLNCSGYLSNFVFILWNIYIFLKYFIERSKIRKKVVIWESEDKWDCLQGYLNETVLMEWRKKNRKKCWF